MLHSRATLSSVDDPSARSDVLCTLRGVRDAALPNRASNSLHIAFDFHTRKDAIVYLLGTPFARQSPSRAYTTDTRSRTHSSFWASDPTIEPSRTWPLPGFQWKCCLQLSRSPILSGTRCSRSISPWGECAPLPQASSCLIQFGSNSPTLHR